MRMGGFFWLDPATTAAGDPHSRSLSRPKPVYCGLILWRCWATAEHGIAQPKPCSLRHIDRALLTAAAERLPPAILDQIKPRGRIDCNGRKPLKDCLPVSSWSR